MSKPWSELRKELTDSDDAKRGYEQARLAYELSVQVREAREAKGLSQSQLAERMGTQQSVVARLEAGGITPTLPTLKRVADALGTKLIVGFDDPAKSVKRQSGLAATGKVTKIASASSGGQVKVVAKTAAKRAAAKRTVARSARRRSR
jgi:ribosome-binding protein aMBF1 (putative translation factor)